MPRLRPPVPVRRAAALALLAALGCSGDPEAVLTVRYDAFGAYAVPSLYFARVIQGGTARTYRGGDFTVISQTGTVVSGSRSGIGLRTGEEATVQIGVILSLTDTVSGSYSFDPERDVDYGVAAYVSDHAPGGFCFNIVDRLPLPARGGSSGDSLFVVQSGLPKGAIC